MKKLISFLVSALLLTAMTIPAFAASHFTPSVEQKGAPEVTGVTLVDANGNEVAGLTTDDLVITSHAKSGEASEEIAKMLSDAYNQIASATTLADLVPDIATALSSISSDLAVEDLVVRDLLDVSLSESAAALLKDGNMITINFDLGLKPDDVLLVLHNYEGSQWEVIPQDRVKIAENGVVSVSFDSLSPVAFVVDGSNVSVDSSVTSPQTGETHTPWMLIGSVVFGVAAITFLTVAYKKRTA